MIDDLQYVCARLPDYHEYGEEAARHDSDMRVRAFVGERLTEAKTRLSGTLDGAASEALEGVLMRCMFTDHVFIHNIEHADLDAAQIAVLVASDRRLVELGEQASTVTAGALPALLDEIDAAFDARRAPVGAET